MRMYNLLSMEAVSAQEDQPDHEATELDRMQMLDKCFTKAQWEFLQVYECVQACAKSLLASLGALCKPISVISKTLRTKCVCHTVHSAPLGVDAQAYSYNVT